MKTITLSLVCLGIALLSIDAQAKQKNKLKDHPSPYLAMHGNDPVHWQVWDKAVFQRARQENKLLFVSIGYFACHWCHVMQRESFQNPETAKILNRDFIPIKVDRELQPALDTRLIEFVERTRGYAGWPLNVFITPEGYPLLGIVYLPTKDFSDLLVNMQQAWVEDMPGMKVMAESAAAMWQKSDRSTGPNLDARQIDVYRSAYIKQAMQTADQFQGGFGEDNKFPLVPQLTLLLQLYKEKGDQSLGEFIRLTLDKMASLGMNDHLRGGFYRYVVDPGWQIPHFEKMLYDNAQLVSLYLQAAELFDNNEYKVVASKTLDFMLRELSDQSGGMISSLSAIDNNNVEGGYYLWSDADLKQLLTPEELQLMKLHWGMQHVPTLEGGHHAQPEEIHLDDPEVGAVLLVPLDDDAAGHRRPLQGHALAQGSGADHLAAAVESQVAGQAVHLAQEAGQCLPGQGDRVLEPGDGRLQGGARRRLLDRFGDRRRGAGVERFGRPVNDVAGEHQRFGRIPQRRTGPVGDHVAHHAHVLLAVALVYVLNHLLPAVGGKIDPQGLHHYLGIDGELDAGYGTVASLTHQDPPEVLEIRCSLESVDGSLEQVGLMKE